MNRNTFSTDEEQNKYLSILSNNRYTPDLTLNFRKTVKNLETLRKRYNKNDVERAVIDYVSYSLERLKRSGHTAVNMDNYFYLDISKNYHIEHLKNHKELFITQFEYLCQQIGDLTKLQHEIISGNELKFKKETKELFFNMYDNEETFVDISNKMNLSILDIINYLNKNKKLLNFEYTYLISICEYFDKKHVQLSTDKLNDSHTWNVFFLKRQNVWDEEID